MTQASLICSGKVRFKTVLTIAWHFNLDRLLPAFELFCALAVATVAATLTCREYGG